MNQPAATDNAIREKLSSYTDPYLSQTLAEAKAVESVTLQSGVLSVGLVLGFPCADYVAELKTALQNHLQPLLGQCRLDLTLRAHGVEVMSIGFMIDQEQPMAWRGPMVTQALTQLLGETNWGELDYLVVDMPPGTGDIQLTLAQRVPVSGAVIVTTPQDIALLDARKGLKMFEKVEVRVLGVVENMSVHVCSQCGHVEHVFGSGGGARMATQYGVQLLGELPLDIRIREDADGGAPTVISEPGSARAQAYFQMARRTAARLATLNKDYSRAFPKITVEAT